MVLTAPLLNFFFSSVKMGFLFYCRVFAGGFPWLHVGDCNPFFVLIKSFLAMEYLVDLFMVNRGSASTRGDRVMISLNWKMRLSLGHLGLLTATEPTESKQAYSTGW